MPSELQTQKLQPFFWLAALPQSSQQAIAVAAAPGCLKGGFSPWCTNGMLSLYQAEELHTGATICTRTAIRDQTCNATVDCRL